MTNIGYRTFNGSTDLLDVALGNLASAASVPETWMFAGRVLSQAADAEIVHSSGYEPLDWYVTGSGSSPANKYSLYGNGSNSQDGPTTSTTVDVIVVVRRGTSTAARWSIATNAGSGWSAFTHTNSAVTFGNAAYPASGVLEFFNTNPMNARCALVGRCNTAISDGDVATLTTDMAAWSALSSLTNLWRFDQTPVVDLEGTSTQNTLTGTTVTAGGFPLDEGGAAPTDLVVADLTVASVADAPTLTQVHTLAVGDLTVAAAIDAPTLTQAHSLAVADLTAATVVDTVTLAVTTDLDVDDLAVAVAVDAPTLTQLHVLAVADLAIAAVIDAPTLTQVHQLSVADLAVITVIDTVTLAAAGDLVVADLTVVTAIEALTLTQVHQLAVADLTVTAAVDTPALTQVHSLTVADVTAGTAIETVTLSTETILDISDLAVATVVGAPTLTQVHQLVVADLTVAPVVDAPALTQVHTLTVASLAVIAALDVVVLILGAILPPTGRTSPGRYTSRTSPGRYTSRIS